MIFEITNCESKSYANKPVDMLFYWINSQTTLCASTDLYILCSSYILCISIILGVLKIVNRCDNEIDHLNNYIEQ